MQRSGRDLLVLLCHEHDELRSMLDRLDQADGDSRRTLLLRLRDSLHTHTRVEEEVLYPAFSAMIDNDAAERLVEDRREEHAFMDRLLDEVLRVPDDSVSFGEDLLLVRETFGRHADQEEDSIFPQMQQACSKEFLEELGVQAAQRREVLRRQSRRRRANAAARSESQSMSKTQLMRKLRMK